MDKKVKIGIISTITIVAISVVTVVILKSLKEDKTGEGELLGEGEVIKVIRYAGEYQGKLDYMYEQVTKGDKPCEDLNIQEAVHWMSNSIIKARGNARRGFIEPTPENIEKLIAIVERSKPTNKNFYEKTLKEWLKGNFIDAKELHNEAWTCLDGDVGKAISADENRIDAIKKEHFEK